MKNIILLITFTLITSCGGDSKSVESIIESNDLTKIRKKRDDLAAKQNDLNNKSNKQNKDNSFFMGSGKESTTERSQGWGKTFLL